MAADSDGTCSYVFRSSEWKSDHGLEEVPPDVPDEWSCHHDAAAGYDRCHFHLSPAETDPDAEREALIEAIFASDSPIVEYTPRFFGARLTGIDLGSASIDLDHNHPIDFRCLRVHGDVDVANATLRQAVSLDATVVEGSLAGHDVTIEDEMIATGAQFRGAVDLSNGQFGDHVRFDEAVIDGDVTFTTAGFEADTSFISTEFNGEISGHHARFDGDLDFSGAAVTQNVWLEDLVVDGTTSLSRTRIDGQLQLERARFGGNCWLVRAEIGDGIHLDGARFDSSVMFSKTVVTGDQGCFPGVTFEDEIDFEGATFAEGVDFSRTQFRGIVSFSSVHVGGPALFTNALFERDAMFLESVFEDNLEFQRADFEADFDLSGAEIGGHGLFEDLSVGGAMGFSRVDVAGRAQFERSRFHNNCWVVRTVIGEGVDFDATTFESRLLFRQSGVGGARAQFAGATFEDEADFSDTIFARGADFSETQFLGHAELQPVYFGGETTFSDSKFEQNASFLTSRFDGDVYCRRSVFEKDANFSGAVVDGNAWFEDVEVRGTLGFSRVEVDGLVQYERSTIEGNTYLKYTEVRDELHFNDVVQNAGYFDEIAVGGDAHFTQTVFSDDVTFRGGQFGGRFNFDGAIARETVTFAETTLHSTLSLREASFGELIVAGGSHSRENLTVDLSESVVQSGYLAHPNEGWFLYDLEDAELGEVTLEAVDGADTLQYFRFKNTSFDGFDFGNHNSLFSATNWTIHNCVNDDAFEALSPADVENTYLKAKNGAKQVGATKAAAEFFIKELRYRRRKYGDQFLAVGIRNKAGLLRRWFGNVTLSVASGYGERPGYVVMWSLGIIGVFSLVFALLLPEQPYDSPIGYLILSTESFVTLLLGGATPVTDPSIRLLAPLEGFLGAFLIALFVFTLTRSIDR
ncbi:pentapeptide repeat-containing protein [Halobellus rufus]|uniref:pentapeptide repeat-containing protein n=1 Tax=Halobellus rufus TaxID=1448860 RepID=UPI000679C14E|nr:pentapeptide repeat-containing protein [Halobellus rufus]